MKGWRQDDREICRTFPSSIERGITPVSSVIQSTREQSTRRVEDGTVEVTYLLFTVYGFARIKITKSKSHIKNRYIGNFMYMSFCILYPVSVVCAACCEFYVQMSFAAAVQVLVWEGEGRGKAHLPLYNP
jgi:hypothetical protein